jgi:hypothetical protein
LSLTGDALDLAVVAPKKALEGEGGRKGGSKGTRKGSDIKTDAAKGNDKK